LNRPVGSNRTDESLSPLVRAGDGLRFPGTNVTQAVFQGADLAEPLPFLRLCEPTDGAGLNQLQARQLSRVYPQEPALDAGFSELGHFSAGHASRQARMQPPMSSAAAA
jgi:hypothetical protein